MSLIESIDFEGRFGGGGGGGGGSTLFDSTVVRKM